MSIINDALKKVQQNIGNSGKKSSTETPFPLNQDTLPPPVRIPKSLFGKQSNTNLATKPLSVAEKAQSNSSTIAAVAVISEQRKYQKILVTLCGLICVTLICLIFYLFYVFSTTHPNPNPAAPAVAAKPAKPIDPIVLQGIMVRDNKNVALINDEIYEVGESVKGRKILNIDEDKVQILDHRKVRTLYLKKKKN